LDGFSADLTAQADEFAEKNTRFMSLLDKDFETGIYFIYAFCVFFRKHHFATDYQFKHLKTSEIKLFLLTKVFVNDIVFL
jgi:hypothetical protein